MGGGGGGKRKGDEKSEGWRVEGVFSEVVKRIEKEEESGREEKCEMREEISVRIRSGGREEREM